jgi:hypothetical protein
MMNRSSISLGSHSGTPDGRPFKSLYKMVRSLNSSTSQTIIEPRKVKRIMAFPVNNRNV